MKVILFVLFLQANAAAAEPSPFADLIPERLGRGPHTLVISDGNAMTRVDYRTGTMCERARNEVRRQSAPPRDAPNRIYGPSTVKAFCVPR